jgi:hypothetical protein
VRRREVQQADIDPAGLARIEPLVERLPGATEDRGRKQRFAEYRMREGLRLPDQRSDQVTVVDDPLAGPLRR